MSYAVVGAVFALLLVTRADADLWGHVRYGLDLIRDGALTTVDPYSFTQDKPWVNHEWLSELFMGLAYQLAGSTGLVLLKAAMLTVVFAIAWSGWRGASFGARFWMVIGLAFGTIHMTSSIRPQVWTMLAMAVLCRTLLRDRPREQWGVPALFAVWVNCHGGWIVGLGVLGVWAAVDGLVRPERRLRWIAVVAATLAATLVNPYGWVLWQFLAETVRMSRNITEWGPLWGTPVLNWIPWAVATAGVLWAAIRPSSYRWQTAAVLAMLSYAALRVMRIESLFIASTAILLAPIVRDRWPARDTPLRALALQHQWPIALALVALTIGGLVRVQFRPVRCIGVWSDTSPDVAVRAALAHAQGGRLVTFFDWGQYALWHFGPQLKVSMDGRRETVYSDARLAEHDAILLGKPEGFATLAAWRAEYVWLPATSEKTEAWLRENGYRIDITTPRSFVAVRDDLPRLPANPDAGPDLATGCFPG